MNRLFFARYNAHYGIINSMDPALPLAAFEELASRLLNRIANTNTRAMYRKGITDFLAWWRLKNKPLDRALVETHVRHLVRLKYSPATVNQRLAAIRRLVGEAGDRKMLDLSTAAAIIRISGVQRRASAEDSSLTVAQAESLINAPNPSSKKGVRDRALLATLVGCALRRAELVGIKFENIQKRNGGWVLLDVTGRSGRVRSVAVPQWTKKALEAWVRIADIRSGPIFRAVGRDGNVAARAISTQRVLPIVVAYGRAVGLKVKPQDLRRTCAQLCRAKGGDLEEIQYLLGHCSVQTTQRYLGGRQRPAKAPNERVRMKWYKNRKLAS